jgi:S-adenosylmethionine/arginine decarboxylase-like enzyme
VEEKKMPNYGKELILDLHECDTTKFTCEFIQTYFEILCDLIDMKREDLHWWIDRRSTVPHLRGISAVQFIETSNVTIHALELLGNVYLNIFSCKDFDEKIVEKFSSRWFKGKVVNSFAIPRY